MASMDACLGVGVDGEGGGLEEVGEDGGEGGEGAGEDVAGTGLGEGGVGGGVDVDAVAVSDDGAGAFEDDVEAEVGCGLAGEGGAGVVALGDGFAAEEFAEAFHFAWVGGDDPVEVGLGGAPLLFLGEEGECVGVQNQDFGLGGFEECEEAFAGGFTEAHTGTGDDDVGLVGVVEETAEGLGGVGEGVADEFGGEGEGVGEEVLGEGDMDEAGAAAEGGGTGEDGGAEHLVGAADDEDSAEGALVTVGGARRERREDVDALGGSREVGV